MSVLGLHDLKSGNRVVALLDRTIGSEVGCVCGNICIMIRSFICCELHRRCIVKNFFLFQVADQL